MIAFMEKDVPKEALESLLNEQNKHLVPVDELKDYVPIPQGKDDPQYLLVLLMR